MKKFNMHILTFFITIMILAVSCSASKTGKEEVKKDKMVDQAEKFQDHNELLRLQNEIEGTWEWKKTECCGRNVRTIYPDEEENPPFKLYFRDHNLVERISDEGRQLLNYHIHYSEIYPERPFISLSHKERPGLIQIEDDMLIINYGYMDLQMEFYKRVH